MPNKYDKLAEQAQAMTDEKFRERFSSLTSLTDNDITKVINDTGISKQDLANLLAAIKNATDFNNQTVKSITSIQKGAEALIAIAKKLLI
jgi:succinate dehydrogenase flavin-adding protein (antitoxin of CptAB toxin-antitoxin module)